MNDWLKTYGWLAGACFAGGWVAWQLDHRQIAMVAFLVATVIVIAGLLSMAFPVIRSLFKWSGWVASAASRLLRAVVALLKAACVAVLVPVLRPALKVVLNERPTPSGTIPPRDANSWTAHEKKYFMNSQRGDLLLIYEGPIAPPWVSLVCKPKTPYWRAGFLLADEDYDPGRDDITGAVLIHIGVSPPESRPGLSVYLLRKALLHKLLDTRAEEYSIQIDFNYRKGVSFCALTGCSRPISLTSTHVAGQNGYT